VIDEESWRAAFPLRTKGGNARHGHFHARGREVKRQRHDTFVHLRAQVGPTPPPLPVEVRLERVAFSGGLDPEDNLPMAMKGVKDEVAAYLGLKDDRDPRVTWTYGQSRGARGYQGVVVTFTRRRLAASEER
jgi:hypothetical protein